MQNEQPVRIYYLSAGSLGVPILAALKESDRIDLTGIGSQPDRPAGRRQIDTPTPLTSAAEEQGLHVDRLNDVNTEEFHQKLRDLSVELLVVASFGQLLKPALLELPPFGCLNIHASILPKYRGASPIQAAILNGDDESGVTFMNMEAGLDTGGVYRTVTCPIGQETGSELEQKLGELAAAHVVDTIWDVARNHLQWRPQDDATSSYARKIKKEHGAMRWAQPAIVLERMVRAYSPWPRVTALLPIGDKLRKIQLTHAVAESWNGPACQPGTLLESDKKGLLVACSEGALRITDLIPEGKTEVSVAALLNGYRFATGTVLPDYVPPPKDNKKKK